MFALSWQSKWLHYIYTTTAVLNPVCIDIAKSTTVLLLGTAAGLCPFPKIAPVPHKFRLHKTEATIKRGVGERERGGELRRRAYIDRLLLNHARFPPPPASSLSLTHMGPERHEGGEKGKH